MAKTEFALNDALSNKLWSTDLAVEVEKASYFGRFMGEGSDSIIKLRNETGKGAGDKITMGLSLPLIGEGRTEGETLEGNEESQRFKDDSLLINELRHATKVPNKGAIDKQRVPYQLRARGKKQLSEWLARRLDTAMFLHLCGYTGAAFTRDGQTIDPTSSKYSGNNTVTAPTSTRIIRANAENADESINSASTHRFILELIDEAVWQAKTTSPMINPIMVGGEEKYVMFLHPSQVKDLRTDGSTSRITWYDTQKAMLQGGQSASKNAIFTGALGEYNGVVLHEAFRITNGVNSSSGAAVANTKRAVLCGAEAASVAFGREFNGSTRYQWTEDLFDYDHELGIAIGTIWGIKKSVFDSKDFGTIVVSSYGKDPV